MTIHSRLRNLRITDCHGLMTDFSEIVGQSLMRAQAAQKALRSAGGRADAHDDDGAPIQLAWKEGEVRLATSPSRPGPRSTRPARCAARLASTYDETTY